MNLYDFKEHLHKWEQGDIDDREFVIACLLRIDTLESSHKISQGIQDSIKELSESKGDRLFGFNVCQDPLSTGINFIDEALDKGLPFTAMKGIYIESTPSRHEAIDEMIWRFREKLTHPVKIVSFEPDFGDRGLANSGSLLQHQADVMITMARKQITLDSMEIYKEKDLDTPKNNPPYRQIGFKGRKGRK